jgi:hypothetical protein
MLYAVMGLEFVLYESVTFKYDSDLVVGFIFHLVPETEEMRLSILSANP